MLQAIQTMPVYKFISKGLLQSIIDTSAGDIRSAMNCITLLAMQLHHSPRLKPDISVYSQFPLFILTSRLGGLQCREGGLDLFHATGRVVYNKRTPSRSASLILGFGDDPDDQVVSLTDLPPHLVDWSRRASKVDIDVSPLSAETD